MSEGMSSSISTIPLKLYTSYLQVQGSNLNVNAWLVLLNIEMF